MLLVEFDYWFILIAYYWSVQIFYFFHDSVFTNCIFLGKYPSTLDYPVNWSIIVYSNLLFLWYHLWCLLFHLLFYLRILTGFLTCYLLSCVWLLSFPKTIAQQMSLCLWNSPGKNTGVGCHFILQGNFATQELNQGLLYYKQILYHLSHLGSPFYLFNSAKFFFFSILYVFPKKKLLVPNIFYCCSDLSFIL